MVPCSLLAENIFSVFRSPHLPLDTLIKKSSCSSEGRAPASEGRAPSSELVLQRGSLPSEIALQGGNIESKMVYRDSRGMCGPQKTEKYFRLIMNRVPEYSHLVFIIPVYLRTITLSKSLVIVQL